jgi:hypothetical protein
MTVTVGWAVWIEAKNAAGEGAATKEGDTPGSQQCETQGQRIDQRGPEMPCFRIIRKWMSMNTASSQGITKVWRL